MLVSETWTLTTALLGRHCLATVNPNVNQNVLCLLMYLPAYKADL